MFSSINILCARTRAYVKIDSFRFRLRGSTAKPETGTRAMISVLDHSAQSYSQNIASNFGVILIYIQVYLRFFNYNSTE